jgi:hypothetical protein
MADTYIATFDRYARSNAAYIPPHPSTPTRIAIPVTPSDTKT